MPEAARIQVEGLRELRRSLKTVGDGYPKELASIHRAVAEPIAKAAKPPRRSGRLAASTRATGTTAGGRVAAGGSRVVYAGPIHWGWPARNIEAQPYLVDALEARKLATLDLWTRLQDELIDRVWQTIR